MANLVRWFTPETGTDWDSTRIYHSTSEDGTYTLLDTVYLPRTYYWDTNGTTSSWYKIAYYDRESDVEGTKSDAFQGIVSEKAVTRTLYVTPTELRRFLQLSSSDYPTDEDLMQYLDRAHIQLEDDIGSTNPITNSSKLKLLALLLTSSFVMQGLAARAVSKGYVSISLEGANIMKAHDALMVMADRYYMKYQEQLAKDTVDYTITNYMDEVVDTNTAQDIKDIMNGVSDGLDYEDNWMPSVNNRSSDSNRA